MEHRLTMRNQSNSGEGQRSLLSCNVEVGPRKDEPCLGRRLARSKLSTIAKAGTLLVATSTLASMNPVRAAHHEEDLLNGAGHFDDLLAIDVTAALEQKNWIVVSPESYTFTHETDYIALAKSDGAEGFFDDGLTYIFQDSTGSLKEVRPKHIHFEVRASQSENSEACDLRFYSVEKVEPATTEEDSKEEESSEDSAVVGSPAGPTDQFKKVEFSDVAFFRLGYFEHAKLNTQNMLQTYGAEEWYVIDLILDWDEQRVSIYMNDSPLKSASFFTKLKQKIESGNALSIYGLTPDNTSSFRNIVMCNDICPKYSDKGFGNLSGAVLGYASGFSLAVGLSTLLISLLA